MSASPAYNLKHKVQHSSSFISILTLRNWWRCLRKAVKTTSIPFMYISSLFRISRDDCTMRTHPHWRRPRRFSFVYSHGEWMPPPGSIDRRTIAISLSICRIFLLLTWKLYSALSLSIHTSSNDNRKRRRRCCSNANIDQLKLPFPRTHRLCY